ncbi:DUF1361 domain-containing protein [Clostridium tetani]|nr:DUF1361 domain-containing protein [Clostridium tetani]
MRGDYVARASKNKGGKNNFKNILMVITFIYFLFIIFGRNLNNIYMIWNLLLAWIPLEISYFFKKVSTNKNKKKYSQTLIILLSVIWIISYPNAPYIITDLAHLNGNKYFEIINVNTEGTKFIFNNDLNVWTDFFYIFIAVWISSIISFASLYINKQIIMEKYNNIFSWLFLFIVSIFSGFNIYLSRFENFRSWNVIIAPYKTIVLISKNINKITFKFCMIFGGIIIIIYMITNLLVNKLKDE